MHHAEHSAQSTEHRVQSKGAMHLGACQSWLDDGPARCRRRGLDWTHGVRSSGLWEHMGRGALISGIGHRASGATRCSAAGSDGSPGRQQGGSREAAGRARGQGGPGFPESVPCSLVICCGASCPLAAVHPLSRLADSQTRLPGHEHASMRARDRDSTQTRAQTQTAAVGCIAVPAVRSYNASHPRT